MLKIIAIIVMTIDHAERTVFVAEHDWMIVLGRLAFPLFAFMIARNGLYTRNPRKYIVLLFLFGILSQPIYAYALDHDWLQPLNVLFTLGLGLMAVQAWKQHYWWALPVIIAPGWYVDYGMAGVAAMPIIAFTIDSINQRGISHPFTFLGGLCITGTAFLINAPSFAPYVLAAFALGFLTLIPTLNILEQKLRWPNFRIFFYCYYPGHLALLALIASLLGIPSGHN